MIDLIFNVLKFSPLSSRYHVWNKRTLGWKNIAEDLKKSDIWHKMLMSCEDPK